MENTIIGSTIIFRAFSQSSPPSLVILPGCLLGIPPEALKHEAADGPDDHGGHHLARGVRERPPQARAIAAGLVALRHPAGPRCRAPKMPKKAPSLGMRRRCL
ncbi:unnamed protein product, partial [Prorocentrum cordatum]